MKTAPSTRNNDRPSLWLAILLIVWNIIDIVVHIAVDMVELYRISGNIVCVAAALIVLLGLAKTHASHVLGCAAVLVVLLNTIHASVNGAGGAAMFVFIGVSLFLLLRWAQIRSAEASSASLDADDPFYHRGWAALLATLLGVSIVLLASLLFRVDIKAQMHDGALEGADYWRDEPLILSAGLGFDNIIGISELSEEAVREAGGTWYGSLACTSGEEPTDGARSSAVPADNVASFSEGYADYDDGLPIVFSWPVATETVDVSDFQFTLNSGEVVLPHSVTMVPNWERNERNVVVVFGDFGNRGSSSEDDVIFPVRLEIVADETPLLLVGPGGQEFDAVGLTWTTDRTPYDAGPALVGAKLNAVGEETPGEGGVPLLERAIGLPNDELTLYDEGEFRIRVLTTGGFSPDGVTGLRPDMYEQFFRVHARGADGETVLLDKVGEEYAVAGGSLRVVGLSDLGRGENPDEGIHYDDCYAEDRDNYIDIILVGDEDAARNVTFVEIPALEGGYRAFYNPGGPGPEPFEGVRYTAPGPPDMEPVIIALDDPMRVDREGH